MDNDQKLSMLLEAVGDSVAADFAQSVLVMHNWDLEAAMNEILSGGGPPDSSSMHDDDVRAPMATGYTDTLMAPMNPAEELRRKKEREAARAVEAEAARLAAEKAHVQDLERQVEQQRREAERAALERRQQKRKAEEAERRRLAELQQAEQPQPEKQQPAPAPPADSEQRAAEAEAEASARRDEQSRSQAAQAAAAAAARAAAAAAVAQPADVSQQAPAAAPVPTAAPPDERPEQAVDAVVQALVALRKRYREADPAALATCLRTLSAYLGNLAHNPQETKFQHINCENAAFRSRVAVLEGATAVLEACGFRLEGAAYVVDPEFMRRRGTRLFDVVSKLEVMIDQLKSAGF
ncbi:unnamed protein product [Polarella glacialis]|uniref:PUB domain-containing protein n=1 Tax=Polarella glacialis TaxID=89957 RepID=A0A813FY75_POLGL|nr:unnamed protein product [Polarella glacialis]